jgi:hypothetical protein
MNTINKIQTAFDKAMKASSAGGVQITTAEMYAVIRAAKQDDGKVDAFEMTTINMNVGRAFNMLLGGQGMTDGANGVYVDLVAEVLGAEA